MADLTGKVAVVLGASAEGGTGWGVAEGLAAAGAKVVVAARSMAPLQKLATKIGGLAVACDAGDEAQIKALRDAAMQAYGRIDIAVNSAATPTISMIADVTPELLQQGLQVNYLGMVHFTRYMAEVMTEAGYARMETLADRLERGLDAAIQAHGAPWHEAGSQDRDTCARSRPRCLALVTLTGA